MQLLSEGAQVGVMFLTHRHDGNRMVIVDINH